MQMISSERDPIYKKLAAQFESLLEEKADCISNLANATALLRGHLGFFWIGFYLVKEGVLQLGPFQGPVACTRIERNRGVCGASWATKKSIVVKDIRDFPGHIACSEHSKSEIVVPLLDEKGEVWAVLDIDSDKMSDFSELDRKHLEYLVKIIERKSQNI